MVVKVGKNEGSSLKVTEWTFLLTFAKSTGAWVIFHWECGGNYEETGSTDLTNWILLYGQAQSMLA